MEKFKNFIKVHADFKVNRANIVALIVVLSIFPAYRFLPEQFGYENGFLENLQMLVLLLCGVFAFKANNFKRFFNVLILFIIIFALREINCGRVFFPIEGEVNSFYQWEEIKYGFIVGPLYEIFIAFSCIWILVKKAYMDLWYMVTKTKLPIWSIVFFLLGMGLSLYADKHMSSHVFEEMAELLMYVSVCGLIFEYGFKKGNIN